LARAIGTDPKNGTARRARDDLLDAGVLHRHPDGTLALAAGHQLPNRELRRELFDHEVASQADFAGMEQVYQRQRASLLADYKRAQLDQIEEAVEATEAAAGNAVNLARIEVQPVDPLMVAGHLQDAATAGALSAREEFVAQLAGVEPVAADAMTVNEQANERAGAVVVNLANGLSTAASKKASAVSTFEATAAGQAVRSYLLELSDAELELQLGGATMQAYNAGRKAFMRAQEEPPPPVTAIEARAEPLAAEPMTLAIYASEVMDENTCGPCADVDGTEYFDLDEAEADYPTGGYVECEGGLRCRGTLVAVYGQPEQLERPAPPPAEPPPAEPKPPATGLLPKRNVGKLSDDVNVKIRADQEAQPGLFYKDTAAEALEQIDSVNRWPVPDTGGKVALKANQTPKTALGHYHPALEEIVSNTNLAGRGIPFGERGQFELLTDSQVTRSTMHHEFGHRLDHQLGRVLNPAATEGPGVRGYATDVIPPDFELSGEDLTQYGPIGRIMQAIVDSGATDDIRAKGLPGKHESYMRSAREFWARAYAQYVATKTGDVPVLTHLSHRAELEAGQWSAEKFKPIEEAFDQAFKELGLRD
jgi:hypothetical protein